MVPIDAALYRRQKPGVAGVDLPQSARRLSEGSGQPGLTLAVPSAGPGYA
jgi:hypothetical protein